MTSFIVPGNPQPKQRPRVTKNGTYTPKRTLLYENIIRTHCPQSEFYEKGVPLRMVIWVYMPIPKSWSKKKKQEAIEGKIYPVSRPDIDNLAKVVSDGLNGFLYYDDSQIVELHTMTRYSEEPRLEITVLKMEE